MKRASAIVTNRGGRVCHAAIISRELGVPAVARSGPPPVPLLRPTPPCRPPAIRPCFRCPLPAFLLRRRCLHFGVSKWFCR